MIVLRNENVIFCDVDETLVHHDTADLKTVDVVDPITGSHVVVGVNETMVRLVKEESHRGSIVVVWSRGGYEWAESVVVALGLESAVDYVMSKPHAYFDDKDISDWLKHRVFIDPKTVYKKQKE